MTVQELDQLSIQLVERQLALVDVALRQGDLESARRRVRITRRLVAGPQAGVQPPERHSHGLALTGQEIATLRLLPDGSMSQKDIALELGVTRNTLKTHLKSLYLKMGVHCRAEAIHRARQLDLLPEHFSIMERPTSLPAPGVDRACA